jgi:hypothetical protein
VLNFDPMSLATMAARLSVKKYEDAHDKHCGMSAR